MQIDKKGLTKREKRLILLLIILSLVVGTLNLIIMPLVDRLTEKSEEFYALDFERMRVTLAMNSESNDRKRHADAIQKYEQIQSDYLSETQTNEIGRILNELCAAHNLRPTALSLSDCRDYLDPDIESADEYPSAAFSIISADMTVSGKYSDLKSLLDAVKDIPYLRVSNCSFSLNSDTTNEYLDIISITFEITLLG